MEIHEFNIFAQILAYALGIPATFTLPLEFSIEFSDFDTEMNKNL